MSPVRLAVDAANLVRDKRGMGRLTRAVLRAAAEDPEFELSLMATTNADLCALRDEFGSAVATRTARERGRYDVVWFPFNGMRYVPKAPSVVAIMDAFAFTEPHVNWVARRREQAPIRRAARRATKIVTISDWSRGEIARELHLDPATIDVVRPTAEPFWQPGTGDALPDGIAGARYALIVGVREARKNARLAIEACARALRGEELLVIAGELQPADRVRALELGLNAGEISPADATLRALYRNATVVLVPSLAEGFGLVALEALACGARVLAADAGALPEATAGWAQLLDPHDVDAWAHAVRAAFDVANVPPASHSRAPLGERESFARAMLNYLRNVARPQEPP